MTHPTNEPHHTVELQTFGRRTGRKLSPRQQGLVDDLLPRVRINLDGPGSDEMHNIGALASLFNVSEIPKASTSPERENPRVWLEIGFGGGEHLVWQAANNPRVNMIGCEPFIDGVVKVLTAIEERSLHNIRLHADDARDLIRRLPAASIDRCFILFPDPWPKKKQQKRRLVSPATLDLLARVMKPGTELRIGTDIADYAASILQAVMGHQAFEWPASGPDDWRVRPVDWPETRYEQKAGREGRACCYFQFRRI